MSAMSGAGMTLLDARFDVYLQPERPWFALYGQWLKPRRQLEVLDAPIQMLLPDEMMGEILARLTPATVAKCCMVCRQWRRFGECPSIWRKICSRTFAACFSPRDLELLKSEYGHSWKRMYTERPHLRYGGVYVSRNTYIRVGIMNLDCRNPVHLVVYYRYFRFFEDGTVLTRTSPDPVSLVWKSLRTMPAVVSKQDTRLPGRWRLKGADVYVACMYPGIPDAEVRCKMKLRSATNFEGNPGFNNRLDVRELFTYDRADGTSVTLEDPAEDDADQQKQQSERGKGTLVFVPWSEVNSHSINANIKQMDVWIPG